MASFKFFKGFINKKNSLLYAIEHQKYISTVSPIY